MHKPDFMPRLVNNNDNNICKAFEASVKKDYFATHKENELGGDIFSSGKLLYGPLDIQGMTAIYQENELLWMLSNNNKVYSIFESRKPYIHMSSMFSIYVINGKATKEDIESLGINQDPSKNGWKLVLSQRSWDDTPFAFFSKNGRVYLLRDGSETDEDNAKKSRRFKNTVGLYRIESNGQLEPTCVVSAAANIDMSLFEKPRINTKQVPETLTSIDKTLAPLNALFRATEAVDGDDYKGGQACHGTNGPYVWAAYYQNRAVYRYLALTRPWELTSKPYSSALLGFLNSWGTQSLYNYRIYQRIAAALPKATDTLAGYYQKQFGLKKDEAGKAARDALDQALSASLVHDAKPETVASIQSNGDPEQFRKRYHEAATNGLLAPVMLRKAVLMGMTDLISDTPNTQIGNPNDGAYGDPSAEDGEPILFYALDNLAIARLLIDKGANIQAGNWFGKTALMYAAQWDLLEIAKLLIDNHINVNAATPAVEDPMQECSAPTITGRTALMYAAENASAPLIEMLLKAGADPKAKDSEGKTAGTVYFERNVVIKGDDRQRISALLNPAVP